MELIIEFIIKHKNIIILGGGSLFLFLSLFAVLFWYLYKFTEQSRQLMIKNIQESGGAFLEKKIFILSESWGSFPFQRHRWDKTLLAEGFKTLEGDWERYTEVKQLEGENFPNISIIHTMEGTQRIAFLPEGHYLLQKA